jgi:type IV pilus modification protein PilV
MTAPTGVEKKYLTCDESGFTLLEVLVTIVIISIALWALSALQTASIGTNYTSRRMSQATMLAQDKLEELKALAWNDAQLADTQDNYKLDSNEDGKADGFDWTLATDHTNSDEPGGAANPITEKEETIANPLATDGYY